MLDHRLISAELLKLRRRRGMIALCGGSVLVALAGLTVAGFVSGPPGGVKHFDDAVAALTILASILGVVVGATAGGSDVEAGVYRDLAATGRGRLPLYGVRVLGALAVVLPLILAAAGLEAAWCAGLARDAVAPSAGDVVGGVGEIAASATFAVCAAIGLAALIGSRGPVIGIVLGFQLGLSPVLAEIGALHGARAAIPEVSVARIGAPVGIPALTVPLAIAILLAWILAALATGAWRTRTQEI